jgi:predicted dehydrogenase
MPRVPADSPINRRQFLGSSAKNAAGVAAGVVGLSAATSLADSANDRIRLAVIGVRGQGKELATSFSSLPGACIAAVCDVDESLLPAVSKSIEQLQGFAPRTERDFRRLLDDPEIDGVIIATPDHWHAVMMVMACQAGKDVYVEKPVSHALLEGERMVAAARRYDRIVQSGLQQRSGSHFQSAVEYVHSGKLGRVQLAKAWTAHLRKSIGHKADCITPQGVDYDLWLGPAQARSFNPNRFHHNWHWFWDYGTGELGNWGVHMLDVARWGLQVEWPTQVSATGGKHYFEDDQQTPDTLVVNYGFPGKTITWEHRLWSHHGIEGRSAAVAFYGDLGTLIVDRGGWKVYGQGESATSNSSDCGTPHHQNFLDAMRNRTRPTADIEIGHVSSAICHLGNIAYRTGRTLQYNSREHHFVRDPVADVLLTRDYRAAWELPSIS